MNVPFLDLKAQYRSIREEIGSAIQEVLDSAAFAGGPFVERFEKEFAAYCGARYAIGVGNGSDALWLILIAMGIGPGDEVITVPNTFIATAEAISLAGARPVFVDVREDTYTMDPALLDVAITPRTKAIIPVHLAGQTADMDALAAAARARGLKVIEDACQAHGAAYKGRRAGSLADAAAFSFYPGKNLGAYGEGGAVTTSDPALNARIRVLRDHGQTRKYVHAAIGWNARLDGIQGAVLSVKLRHLEAWNEARRKHAARYDELLAGVPGLRRPVAAPGCRHVYHLYAARIAERERVVDELKAAGVSTLVHYPVPVHLQQAYESLGLMRGSFPVSERLAGETLSLPMYAELTEEQIRHVADSLRGARSRCCQAADGMTADRG